MCWCCILSAFNYFMYTSLLQSNNKCNTLIAITSFLWQLWRKCLQVKKCVCHYRVKEMINLFKQLLCWNIKACLTRHKKYMWIRKFLLNHSQFINIPALDQTELSVWQGNRCLIKFKANTLKEIFDVRNDE